MPLLKLFQHFYSFCFVCKNKLLLLHNLSLLCYDRCVINHGSINLVKTRLRFSNRIEKHSISTPALLVIMYKSEKNNKNVFETESGARRSNQPVGPSRSNNVSSLCKGQGTRSRCEESIWSKENSNKTRKTVSNHNDKLRGQPQLPHQMGFVPFAHYSISTSQYAQLQTSTYSFNRQFSGNLVPNMYFRRKENESASTSNTGPTTNEGKYLQCAFLP